MSYGSKWCVKRPARSESRYLEFVTKYPVMADLAFRQPAQKTKPSRFSTPGLLFSPPSLMSGERGAGITGDALIVHYCDRWIVFGRQDAKGGWL